MKITKADIGRKFTIGLSSMFTLAAQHPTKAHLFEVVYTMSGESLGFHCLDGRDDIKWRTPRKLEVDKEYEAMLI